MTGRAPLDDSWSGAVRRVPRAVPATSAAATAFAAATVAATRGVGELEAEVLRAVHRLGTPVELALWVPMQAGSAAASLVVGALAAHRWHRWRPAVGSVVVGLGAWWTAKLVKAQIGRGRPAAEVLDFVALRTAPADGLGYPSGHAAVAFALATVVSPYLSRRGRIGAYALASTVALARVAIGAHLPLDVVGGATLGSALGGGWLILVGTDADGSRRP